MAVGSADRDRRTAWVAGATGRLGDALVEQILASGRYRRLCVVSSRPMATTVAGFEAVDLATLAARLDPATPPAAGQPAGSTDASRCDDLYLLLDPDAPRALEAAGRHDPRRRSALPPFEPLVDSESALTLATLAEKAGARNLLLLAPLAAWQQLSSATRILPDGLELKLAGLRIPRVLIMKPSGEGGFDPDDLPVAGPGTALPSTAPSLARSASSTSPSTPELTPRTSWWQGLNRRLERFSRFYLNQLRFMLPTSSVVIRSVDLARIAVELVTGPDRPGLQIIDIDWIEDRLREKRGLPSRAASRPSSWRPQR